MQEYRKKRAKLAIPNGQKEKRLLLELEFEIDESVGLAKNFILTPAGYSFPVVGEERNRKSDASQVPPPIKNQPYTNRNPVWVKDKLPSQAGKTSTSTIVSKNAIRPGSRKTGYARTPNISHRI